MNTTATIQVHKSVLKYQLVPIHVRGEEGSYLSKDDKVQFKVWISNRTDERFRAFVSQKSGTFTRGPLSFEAERALIGHMDKGGACKIHRKGDTHIGTNMCPSPRERAEQLIDAISSWVMKEYNQSKPPTEIPYEYLKKAIMAVAGVQDKRSIKSRIDLLKAYGLIKAIDDKLYTIPHNMTETTPPAPPVQRGTFREVF
jgi:hypothetical protein